jgi:AcrR family transcriptional regulator
VAIATGELLPRGDFELVSTDMNLPGAARPRPYRMQARAEATAGTRARILRAVLELHVERFHDQITLEAIARRAGVTVQTVLRHFGTRDRLVAAAAEQATRDVVEQRSTAPVGDVAGAVENLLDHYEEWGRSALRLLAQEERVPQLRVIADGGRAAHHAWVERTFGPFLAGTSDQLLRPKLIALTDVFTWKLLRLDLGLDRTETASALASMIRAVVGDGRRP